MSLSKNIAPLLATLLLASGCNTVSDDSPAAATPQTEVPTSDNNSQTDATTNPSVSKTTKSISNTTKSLNKKLYGYTPENSFNPQYNSMTDVLFAYMTDNVNTEQEESSFIAGGAYRTFHQLVREGKITPPQNLIDLNEQDFNEQFLLGFLATVNKAQKAKEGKVVHSEILESELNPVPYFKVGLTTYLKNKTVEIKALNSKTLQATSPDPIGFNESHLKGKTYYVISDKMDMTVEMNSAGTQGEGSMGWVSMDFDVAIDGNKHLVIDSSMMGRYSIQSTYIDEGYCIAADAISEDGDAYVSFWFTDESTMEKADGIPEAKALCEINGASNTDNDNTDNDNTDNDNTDNDNTDNDNTDNDNTDNDNTDNDNTDNDNTDNDNTDNDNTDNDNTDNDNTDNDDTDNDDTDNDNTDNDDTDNDDTDNDNTDNDNTDNDNTTTCTQVITYALNPFKDDRCEKFNNPCAVPKGWQSCSLNEHPDDSDVTPPEPTPDPIDNGDTTPPPSDSSEITIGMDIDSLVLSPALTEAFTVALQSGQMINEILALSTRFTELNDLLVQTLQTDPSLEQKVCTQLTTNEHFGELFTGLARTETNMETYLMGSMDENLYSCLSNSFMLSDKSAINFSALLNENATSYVVTPSNTNNANFANNFFNVGSDSVHGDASEIATEKMITGLFSDRRALNNFADALSKVDEDTQDAYLNFIFKGDLPNGDSNVVQGYYNLYALTAGALIGSATSGEESYSEAFSKFIGLIDSFSYWDFGWQLWDAGKYYTSSTDVTVDHLKDISFTTLLYDFVFGDEIDDQETKSTQSFFFDDEFPEVNDLYGNASASKEDLVVALVPSLTLEDIAQRRNYRYNKVLLNDQSNHWLYLPNTLSREAWLNPQATQTLEVGAKSVKVYLISKENKTLVETVSTLANLTQDSTNYAESTDGVYNIYSTVLKNQTVTIQNANAYHIVVVPLNRDF